MCAQPLPPIASRLTSCPPPPPPADTHYAPYMIHPGGEFQDGSVSQWSPRLEFARKEGWLNRSIPCLGMLFGKSKLNPTGWSQQQLRAAAEELKVSTAGRRRSLLHGPRSHTDGAVADKVPGDAGLGVLRERSNV